MSAEPFDIIDTDPFDPEVIRAAEDQQFERSEAPVELLREYVRQRTLAYLRVFGRDDNKAEVEFIMRDLAAFCRAFEARFRANDREHALLEGRAEVFYRIMDYTRLDRDTLYVKLATAKTTGG